ncbi:MAG: Asp23/Gls24 family envelope stress response protein [Deinococcales bacterium]|nr:Asp23/Gls24 family envelope stress response protein [Deinococcales bacterium]
MSDSVDLAISPDVLYGIVQLALEEVDGVRPIQPPARVGEFLGGRRGRGIVVERDGGEVWVDLTLAVAYGKVIPKVAHAAQKAVREAVASMTGLTVKSVNVAVEDVELPEEELPRG